MSKLTRAFLTLIILTGCSQDPVKTGAASSKPTNQSASGDRSVSQGGAEPTLKCLVADEGNRNQVAVSPLIQHGSQVTQPSPISYGGHSVSAIYNVGDEFESQRTVIMQVDDTVSISYLAGTPEKNALYTLSGKDYFFQCWFW